MNVKQVIMDYIICNGGFADISGEILQLRSQMDTISITDSSGVLASYVKLTSAYEGIKDKVHILQSTHVEMLHRQIFTYVWESSVDPYSECKDLGIYYKDAQVGEYIICAATTKDFLTLYLTVKRDKDCVYSIAVRHDQVAIFSNGDFIITASGLKEFLNKEGCSENVASHFLQLLGGKKTVLLTSNHDNDDPAPYILECCDGTILINGRKDDGIAKDCLYMEYMSLFDIHPDLAGAFLRKSHSYSKRLFDFSEEGVNSLYRYVVWVDANTIVTIYDVDGEFFSTHPDFFLRSCFCQPMEDRRCFDEQVSILDGYLSKLPVATTEQQAKELLHLFTATCNTEALESICKYCWLY